MRSILFFDLPTLTNKDLKNYRHFIKNIKKCGFYMLQESVYIKLSIDHQAVDATINKIRGFAPNNGSIMVLNITEKQFAQINVISGTNITNVLNDDNRVVIL